MTRVDFYVLADASSPEQFACALTSKARKKGLPVYIHTDDRQAASRLDDLLWTFRDTSFLPHALVDDKTDEHAPVKLGWDGNISDCNDVIINLGQDIPDCVSAFNRVMEIVVADKSSRDRSREHYKKYREMGFEVNSHNME